MESANWKKQKVQLRRGTAAEWTARNTLLLPAEPGYETDTGRLKLGDGLTRWNSLAYWGAAEVSSGDYGQVIVNQDGTWSVDITPADIGASAVGHTHSASEIASGTLSDSRLSGNVVLTADARLSDAREWSAGTITQADAEAGVSTARQAFTALRVFQAIAAWWAGSAAKTKLDGIAAGATANSTDAQLRDRTTHTGSQAISTVTGLQTALDLKSPLASPAFTGQVAIPAGSASAPPLTFSGDTDTGIHGPATNTVAIATAGVERMRVGPSSGVFFYDSTGTASHTFDASTSPNYTMDGAIRSGLSLKGRFVGATNIGNINFLNATDTLVAAIRGHCTSDQSTSTGTLRLIVRNDLGAEATPAIAHHTGMQFLSGSAASPSVCFQGDTDTGLLAPSANNLAFATGGVERVRIDSAGRILVATSVSRSAGPTIHPQFQMEGASAGAASFQFAAASTTAAVCPQVLFARHRGAVGGSDAVVANDSLGLISFTGGDGTDINNRAAFISAEVDGTPDTNSIPGRIVFATTIQAGTSTLERMRITNDGNVGIGTTAPSAMLDVNSSKVRVRSSHTPASASATGNAGDICWDSSYIYVCTATNTWRRIAHSTW